MRILLAKEFDKQYKSRLSARQKRQVIEALLLFGKQPYHKDFRNHALKGKWRLHRSISIGGDLRLHYREFGEDVALFVAVGSHQQLYQ